MHIVNSSMLNGSLSLCIFMCKYIDIHIFLCPNAYFFLDDRMNNLNITNYVSILI